MYRINKLNYSEKETMMETLKMYVWNDILCDYHCGLVCILAHNLEEAMDVAKATWGETEDYILRELHGFPIVYDKPSAVYVYGGA